MQLSNNLKVLMLLLLTNVAVAEVNLNKVKVYSSPVALQNVTKSVQIITAQQIQQTKATTLVEALQIFIPGAVTSYGKYANSGLYSKGASPHSTLLLINGVKLTDVTRGSFDIGYIPLTAVERIELINNSDGVAYGSQAVVGAINIITKAASFTNQFLGQVEVGTRYSKQAEVGYLANLSNHNFSIFASIDASEGQSVSATKNVIGKQDVPDTNEKDGYTKQNIILRYILANALGGELEWFANFGKSYVEYDHLASLSSSAFPYFYLADAEEDVITRNDYFSYIKYNTKALGVNNYFYVSYNAINRKEYQGAIQGKYPKDFRYKSNVLNANYYLDKTLNKLYVKTGIDYDFIHFKEHLLARKVLLTQQYSGINPTSHVQSSYSAYGLINYTLFNNLTLNSGVRYNYATNYNKRNNINYSTGLVYSGSWYKIKSNYFVAYKVPNLFELYDYENGALVNKQSSTTPSLPPFKLNNNTLLPEKNTGADLTTELSLLNNKLNLSTTVFATNIKNLITLKYRLETLATQGEPFRTYYNTPNQIKTKGINASISYNVVKPLTIGLNYNYLHTNIQLPRRPKQALSLSTTYNANNKYVFNFTALAVDSKAGGFFIPAGKLGSISYPDYTPKDWSTSGYVVLNASFDYNYNKKITIYSKLQNILNKKYQNAYGFKADERGFYVGVKWNQ